MFDEESLQQLYRYCYSLNCNKDDAYDLLQSALEKFLKSNTSANQPMAYIKRIIRNQYIDECRRQKIVEFESYDEIRLPIEITDIDVQTLESLHISSALAEQILKNLAPDEREIMYYWAVEGYSTFEIAEKLEKPKGTILSKIYRIRKRLLEQFNDDSNDVMEVRL